MDRHDPYSIQSTSRTYMTPGPEDDGVCELPGCQKKKYRDKDGTVHPFCSRSHGRLAKQDNQLQVDMTPGPEDDGVCELSGCQKKKYRDKDGTVHPFCSRSHGKLAKQDNQLQVETLATRKRPPSSSSPLTTKKAPPVVRGGKNGPGMEEKGVIGVPGPSASFPSSSRYREIERFLNSGDVVDLFLYCNLKNDAILGELFNKCIINREQQQKMMSESAQVTANKIVRKALLEDPSEKKLETFGEILKRSESDANQKLAERIATFLQPDTGMRTTTPSVPASQSDSNVPDDVHYVIMTSNKNEWKSAQHFLGVDCEVSEKVKRQTFKDDEDLIFKMEGIDPEISMQGTTYQFFTVNQKAAVLMKCSNMGSFSHQGSLHEAFKLLNKGWPLKAIFIVGCCGAMGKGEEDQIGSVFVGDKIYYYGLGKITEGGIFKSRFDPYRLDSLGCETLESKGSPRIKSIKTVSMLSGDFVMKDEHAADERCTRLEEKQVGFEMEGVGVVTAVNLHMELEPSKIPPKIVLVKGVSDHADAMKNKDIKFTFFSEEIPNVDEDTRQQMCTIMSLTVALRAICKGFLKD